MDIEDNHPLRKRVKYEHIVPCCTRCCKSFGFCKRPETKRDVSGNVLPLNDFSLALRSTLLYNIDPKLKIPKAER